MRRWKRRAARVGICVMLVGTGSGLCLQDGFQHGPGIFPIELTVLAAESTGGQSESLELTETDWEMDFTDTDTSRGMLAVRSDVFQGFGGTINLWIAEKEAGKEIRISLLKGSQYMANRELKPGSYFVCALEADSDGRKFGCSAEPMELEIKADNTSLCRIFVSPDSVYQFPYEEPETIGVSEVDEEVEGRNHAELASVSETERLAAGDEAGAESGADDAEVDKGEDAQGENAKGGVSLALFTAVLGLVASLRGIFSVLKSRRGR